MMSVSGRKPRCVGALATYLNSGLWGSRFVGDCELSTNGERVWLKGRRVPMWMALARVFSYVAFLPVTFYTGMIFGETLIGKAGYPPYYYLSAALLTFLLVVLGLWGSGIWNTTLGTYEAVSWPAGRVQSLQQGSDKNRSTWVMLNRFFNMSGWIQVEVPIGPGGKLRRLVLKTKDSDPSSLMAVLSGSYYGPVVNREVFQMVESGDPWNWSRN